MSFLRSYDVYADGCKTATKDPLDFDGHLFGSADYSSFGEVKTGRRITPLFYGKNICPLGHKTKNDGRILSISPVCGCPHISEAAYIEKGRNRGQVCVEPHIWGKIPYRIHEELHKKTLGGNPKCFCIVCRILKVDAIENPTRFQVF